MSTPVFANSRCQTMLTLSQSLKNLLDMENRGEVSASDLKYMIDVILEEFKLVRKYQKINEIAINKNLAEKL